MDTVVIPYDTFQSNADPDPDAIVRLLPYDREARDIMFVLPDRGE